MLALYDASTITLSPTLGIEPFTQLHINMIYVNAATTLNFGLAHHHVLGHGTRRLN